MSDEESDLLVSSAKSKLRERSSSSWRRLCCSWLPARYVLTLMGFLGFCNVYALRVNLSMAIVQMVNDSQASGGDQYAHKVDSVLRVGIVTS